MKRKNTGQTSEGFAALAIAFLIVTWVIQWRACDKSEVVDQFNRACYEEAQLKSITETCKEWMRCFDKPCPNKPK